LTIGDSDGLTGAGDDAVAVVASFDLTTAGDGMGAASLVCFVDAGCSCSGELVTRGLLLLSVASDWTTSDSGSF
jgi:hypothetical protein